MNRAFLWSVAIHVGVVLGCIFVPRDWIRERPKVALTITLGGAVGPKTTGTTSIGGRTVEQVAPPPKRPEPIRPAPKNEPAPLPVKAAPAAARPIEKPEPVTPAPTRPPTTGQQVVVGSTPIDTGARGRGVGLTSGGGGTGGETDLRTFCCPEYLQLLQQRIDARWDRRQPEKGVTEIRFTILKDGTITNLEYALRSGSTVLDRVSRNAVSDTKMPPLPQGYPDDKLVIRITFPYEGY